MPSKIFSIQIWSVQTEGYYNKETNTLYIQSSNSDAAGNYVVVWKIAGGVYAEGIVSLNF